MMQHFLQLNYLCVHSPINQQRKYERQEIETLKINSRHCVKSKSLKSAFMSNYELIILIYEFWSSKLRKWSFWELNSEHTLSSNGKLGDWLSELLVERQAVGRWQGLGGWTILCLLKTFRCPAHRRCSVESGLCKMGKRGWKAERRINARSLKDGTTGSASSGASGRLCAITTDCRKCIVMQLCASYFFFQHI